MTRATALQNGLYTMKSSSPLLLSSIYLSIHLSIYLAVVKAPVFGGGGGPFVSSLLPSSAAGSIHLFLFSQKYMEFFSPSLAGVGFFGGSPCANVSVALRFFEMAPLSKGTAAI